MDWKPAAAAVKVVVFAFAAWGLVGYAREYGVVGLLLNASVPYLLLAGLLSAASFMLQVKTLEALSSGRLRFREALEIEYYTMLLNLGIASSLFSLPKIALVNRRMRDLGHSTRIFIAQTAVGVAARIVLVAAAGLMVWGAGTWTIPLAAFIAAAALAAVRWGGSAGRLLPGGGAGMLMEVSLLTAAGLSCAILSYYAVLASYSAHPGFLRLVYVEGLGYLSGFFSPIPAGIGVREYALTELHGVLSVTEKASFSAAVTYRLVSTAACLSAAALALRMPGMKPGRGRNL